MNLLIKRYREKHTLSRNHGMLFSSENSTGISNGIRGILFKKLTLEVLYDITKIPKERQNMCLRKLEIHSRFLIGQASNISDQKMIVFTKAQ